MLGNIKVAGTMIINYIGTLPARKKYGCDNKGLQEKKESRKHLYPMARKLACNMLKAANTKIEISGEENLPEKGPVLYVANHKSIFDIVILVSIIKEPCIFIGKKEVAKMPIAGGWFKDLGCIYIDRQDIRQSLKAIMEGISELKNGQSVVVFPEGTRTHSKEMKDFKEGSFKLAAKTMVPIIPIALQDTYKIFEEKRSIQKVSVKVNIGKTIYQERLSEEDRKKLPAYVQDVIKQLLSEITQED